MHQPNTQVRISFGGPLTPAVKALLWVNGLAYVLFALAKDQQVLLGMVPTRVHSLILVLLGLVPHSVTHAYTFWQPITYMFVHMGFFHVLMNMLGLWWFGVEVERHLGTFRFLRFYFLCGLGGAIAAILLNWNSMVSTIGASGAVFGVLLAFGMLFPNRVIYLYFVLPVKAKYCVAAAFLMTVYALFRSSGGGDTVSHIAHFGGLLTGLLWFGTHRLGIDFRSYWRSFQRSRMRKHLRLIHRQKDGEDEDPYSNKTVH